MRNLVIHRERALAAFALTYYIHLNRDRDQHLQALQQMADPRLEARGDYGLKNGQTVKIPIGEEGTRFFVGIYTQEKNHVSLQVPVEPGKEDVYFQIVTDFDGNKRLSFRIEAVNAPND